MPPTEKNKLQEDTNLGASIPQMFSGTKVHYSGLMYQTKLWAVDIFFKMIIMSKVCKRLLPKDSALQKGISPLLAGFFVFI